MAIDIRDLNSLRSLSVQVQPGLQDGFGSFVISLASTADAFPPWGTNAVERDRALRQFYVTEPWLAGAVSALSARNAAMSWTIEAGPRVAARLQEILHLSDLGQGWTHMMERVSTDLLTQDNGAFIEVLRDGDGVFKGLSHLDAGQCVRTGNQQYPVVYTDRDMQQHKMAWDRIIDLTDQPSPVESMNGMQLCAVSRVLRIAQVLRDVAIRKQEKVSGRFSGALHIVSGINLSIIQDAFKRMDEESNNRGRSRYQPPIIAGTLDPTAKVSKETIELASLPDGWNEEEAMKWYIAVLALCFQCEYQDLAPLPGGGLGSSNQSAILHMKAKGRGPALWKKIIEHKLNFYILPDGVTFRYDEKDYEADKQEWEARKLRAETRAIDVSNSVLTVSVARQMMEDDGDLKDEYLQMMAEEDVTEDETVSDQSINQQPAEVDAQQAVPDQGGQPTTGGQGRAPAQTPLQSQAKQLTADDYYGRQRERLEKEYEEEMGAVLAGVRRKVLARVRAEVSGG